MSFSLRPASGARQATHAPLLLLAVATLLAGCAAPPAAGPSAAVPATAAATAAASPDLPVFDPALRPQDDLFRSANERWLKAHPIPADKSSHGSIAILRDQADLRVRRLAEELVARGPRDEAERRIADHYASVLDTDAIDRAGLAPAAPWLGRIDALASAADVARAFGELQGIAATPLSLSTAADAKGPGVYRLYIGQSGLGLPDRDYYLQDNPRFVAARDAYRAYLRALLQAAGDARPDATADAVYALEQRLATAQSSRVDNRDPLKLYNPRTPEQLQRDAALPWGPMLQAAAFAPQETVVAMQPAYLQALAAQLQATPLPVWQAYLRVRLLAAGAELLPRPLREARFAYEDKALAGIGQPPARWQVAVRSLNAAMGDAVGRLYVARHFPPAYQARMQGMVEHLLAAYRESIDGLAWMGPDTRRRAQEKLARMAPKIGAPTVWRDDAALQVRAGDAFGNRARAGRFEHERRARRAGQPVDRREWSIPPQTVNAYYSPLTNEIVFPAGILEPPFFDMAADDAANYGAIGAVIGHEISHGFDDSGSRFDAQGRLENWWTDADRRAFEALAARLVAQYDAYEPLPGQRINGRLTLGENIADLSGLQIAHKAWRRSLQGRPAPVVGGLDGEQRFFAGWARAWRSQVRDERLLQQLVADPHSPNAFRANGAAVNHDAFHDAFGTRPGDGMFKPVDERIRIW